MSHPRRAGLFAILLSLPLPPSAAAEDPVADLFARTAREDGVTYRVGSDLLQRQGEPVVPFLREKQKSTDWRQRDLARSLLLRIAEPEKVAAWSKLFDFATGPPTFAPDGAALVPLTPDELAAAQTSGKVPLRDGRAVLDGRAAPLLLDYLREDAVDRSAGPVVWGRVLDVLGRLAPADAAPALVDTLERVGGRVPGLEDALVQIGRPAVPVLHGAVRTCPVGTPKTDTEEGRRAWMRMMAAPAVARVLARIGDKETPRVLLEKLDTVEYADQIVAYCEALAELRAADAMPTVFTQVLHAAGAAGRESWTFQRLEYGPMRRAMLGFGPPARAFLRAKARDARPMTRAVAEGLLFEMDDPEAAAAAYRAAAGDLPAHARDEPLERGYEVFWHVSFAVRGTDRMVPTPLRVERAAVHAHPADLLRLARLRGNTLALEIASAGLLREYQPGYEHVALAMAEGGDGRALDTFRKVLESRWPAEPLVTAAVEALLLLGDPKGVPVLEALVRRAEAVPVGGSNPLAEGAEVARAVLPALRGNAEHVVTLLQSDRPSVRTAAASVLARKGDLRAVPVLAQGASAPGPRRVDLRNDLVRLGKPALPRLEKERTAEDARVRLVCEAAALRITRPELAAALGEAAAVRDPGFESRAGPSVETYRGAGTRIARAVGRDAIPLLEEAATFDDEPPHAGVAIFALAHFKEDRSLPVVVVNGARGRLARDGTLVAAALRQFGDEGIEAAKAIPAPDPDKARFAERAVRHRAGTEALALEKDIRGVDNILDGLQLPLPDRTKPEYDHAQSRAQTYLRFAAKYEDKRLVEPLLKLAEGADQDLALLSLEALGGYDDRRIVPLALKWLGRTHEEWYANRALKVLVRRLGPGVVPLLSGRLRTEGDEAERLAAARALGNLGARGQEHWRARFPEAMQAEKAAADARTPTIEALLQALADARPAVQAAAAEALVDWSGRPDEAIRDPLAVAPLAEWVRTKPDAPPKVVQYLARSQDPAAGSALLAAYRASGHRSEDLAAALGQLGYADAVPDLARGLELALSGKGRGGLIELDALAGTGPAGLESVRDALKTARPLPVRQHAGQLLGRHRVAEAVPDVAALFEAVAVAGPASPDLPGDPQHRDTTYVRMLTELAEGLATADPQAAHALFGRMLFTSRERLLAGVLAEQVKRLEAAQPELKCRPVPAAPTQRDE